MCGVMAATGLIAATSLVGGAIQYQQQKAAQEAAEQQAEYQRAVTENQIKQQKVAQALRAEDRREQMQRALGEQKTALSSAGVLSDGSLSLSLQGDTAKQFERDQFKDDFNTSTQMTNTRASGQSKAQSLSNRAATAGNRATGAAIGSLFEGASRATSTYIAGTRNQ